MKVKLAVCLVASLGVLAVFEAVEGQTPYRGYAPPAGPTLPYQLEYFRPQSGVLDQYNQFVAPRENLAGQMRALTQQQHTDFQAVQNQLKESDQIRESRAAATGTAATFMNYSHYYSGRGATANRPTANRTRTPLPNPAASFGGFGNLGGLGMGYGT